MSGDNTNMPTDFFTSARFLSARETFLKRLDRQGSPSFKGLSAIMPDIVKALGAEFNHRCAYCRCQIGVTSRGCADHFHPKHRFPALTFERSNLVLSCDACNNAKGGRFPEDANGKALLINPRVDNFDEHLRLQEDGTFLGLTPRGTTSIAVLNLNRPALVKTRRREPSHATHPVNEQPSHSVRLAPVPALNREIINSNQPLFPNARTITPDELLRHMRADDGLYVLGCFERRVTFMAQQVRALNLVYALHERKVVPEDGTILVVGGSIAGMTAAAGAARLGYKVTLIEKEDALMPLFRNNETRWVHPYVYDWPIDELWPTEEEARDWAQVPLLRWRADSAGRVARQIEEAWRALPEHGRIDVHRNAKITDIGRGTERDVRWKTKTNHRKTFGAVILAVGFGMERQVARIPWMSYWKNDDLWELSHEGHMRYLISGIGDGGLIDVLRVSLRDFRHDEMLADFVNDPALAKVKSSLVAIEKNAIERAQKKTSGLSQYLYDAYEKLSAPSVDAAIEKRLREGVTVVLNGRDPNPFSLRASILGRFLVSRLLFAFNLEYRPGDFPKPQTIKGGFKVQFEIGAPETFHRIICRHGPEPALEKEFPQVWKNCAVAMRAYAELDQTRWPIYEDAFAVAKR